MEIAPACLKWPQNSLRGQVHMHRHKGGLMFHVMCMINFSDRCWPRRLGAKRDLTPSPRKLIILRAGGVTSRVHVAYKRPEAPKTPPGRLGELQLGRWPTAWHLGSVAPGRGFFLHETICMKRSRCSKISKSTALESLNSHHTLLRVVSLSQSETDSHAL